MKKYVIIDNKGDTFEEVLDTDDRETAIAMADADWERFTKREQKHRQEFYLGYTDFDEDGCVDYDTMEIIKDYLQEWKDA